MFNYCLENYYIGIFDSFTYYEKKTNNNIEVIRKMNNGKIINAIINGAIAIIENDDVVYPDYLENYYKVISIFYSLGNSKYICLHNGVEYSIYNNSNIIPLSKLLPKVDYDIPNCINTTDALKLFNTLFQNNNNTLFNKNKHALEEYYIANISYYAWHEKGNKKEYIDLPERLMLKTKLCSIKENGYCIEKYNSLFLKYDKALLNLYNNQLYLPKVENTISIYGMNCYEKPKQLSLVLDDKKKLKIKKKISISKAIDIYEEIRKEEDLK